MLQNARVTAFTAFELLRENQQGGCKIINPEKFFNMSELNTVKLISD